MRKLYVVTVSKAFYFFGDAPPRGIEAERCADNEGVPFDVESYEIDRDDLGAGLDSLVHGPDEDTTLAEAIAEVTRDD